MEGGFGDDDPYILKVISLGQHSDVSRSLPLERPFEGLFLIEAFVQPVLVILRSPGPRAERICSQLFLCGAKRLPECSYSCN